MARKPFKSTVSDNVLKYGTGAINIDGCRIGDEEISVHNAPKGTFAGGEQDRGSDTNSYKTHVGRWPANFIHNGSEEEWSKFFYCPKASKTDRNEGCEELEEKQYSSDGRETPIENAYQRNNSISSNSHQYLKHQYRVLIHY